MFQCWFVIGLIEGYKNVKSKTIKPARHEKSLLKSFWVVLITLLNSVICAMFCGQQGARDFRIEI
jgi:uncharacterized membrane protein